MSDTPRTSAMIVELDANGIGWHRNYAPTALCKNLERELTAANEKIAKRESELREVIRNLRIERNEIVEASNARIAELEKACGILSKENMQMRGQLAEARKLSDQWQHTAEELKARLDEARKDSVRLDWFFAEENDIELEVIDGDFRAAIDAASQA